jgi:uracil-DNA glycosylase family 4
MILQKELVEYLTWQKDIGGREVIIDKAYKKAVSNLANEKRLPQAIITSSQIPKSSTKAQKEQPPTASPIETKKKENVFLSLPEFKSLEAFYKYLDECGLYKSSPSENSPQNYKIVKATGNPKSSVAAVSLIPTETDLEEGSILQGAEGQVFNDMLDAIKLKRSDIYCTSIIKNPHLNKMLNWRTKSRYRQLLGKELQFSCSSIILLLGQKCCQLVLKTGKNLEELRKNQPFQQKNDILSNRKIFVTYHPHELLINPKKKKSAGEDFKLIQKALWNHQKQ